MPLQLYEKDQVLDTCIEVFAFHGYEKTSTVMLTKAAGISRALIFHHFKSKKELFLSLLDRSIEKGKIATDFETLLETQDFFQTKEMASKIKFQYFKENPSQ